MHFLGWKCFILIQISLKFFYQWSYQQWAIIGSDNDLVSNRHHYLDQWWHSLPVYVNVTLMDKLTSETWTVPAMAHVIICGVNTSWNNYHIGQLSFITGCPGPIIALNFTYLIHRWFYRKFPYKPIGNSYPPGAILSHYVQHPTDPVKMLPRTKNITKKSNNEISQLMGAVNCQDGPVSNWFCWIAFWVRYAKFFPFLNSVNWSFSCYFLQ